MVETVSVVLNWLDFVNSTPSFLSPSVQELFKFRQQQSYIPNSIDGCLTVTGLLSNSYLASLFNEDDESLSLHPMERCANWYNSHLCKAHSLIPYLTKMLEELSVEEVKELVNQCSWLHQQSTIQTCFDLLLQKSTKEKDELNAHECLLLVTAMLERGLGNVFLCVNPKKKVPSLLRDLLATEELLGLLGQPTIGFLQLLLGSPLSLNLRNLCWHGFVGCGDIQARDYASVLLVACSSIGSLLEHRHSITAGNIVPRRWAGLNRLPPKFMDFCKEEFSATVNSTRGIPSNRKPIWLRAFQHHLQGNYGRCCVLILPEMEHILRLMYCAANNCPTRLLTAESVVHYTTLDTILDASTNLPSFLGNSLFSALRDVFMEEEGPRIRDRFSHGECELSSVSPVISQQLLSLSIGLLRLTETSGSVRYPSYSAYFSLAAIFKRELLGSLEELSELILSTTGIEPLPLDLSAWPQEYRILINCWLSDWSSHQQFIGFLSQDQCARTTIPSSNTWRQIMRKVKTGCSLIMQYKKSTLSAPLRSRQRATQVRFEGFLPVFIRGIQLALLMPIAAHLGGDLTESRQSEKVKKINACWADNLASNSSVNRWNELFTCTKRLEACFSSSLPIEFNCRKV